MAATPVVAREASPTEVRRRMAKAAAACTPGAPRDPAEERLPVNKKVKMSSPPNPRGDEVGPLFVGEARGLGGSGGGSGGGGSGAKGKATQTTVTTTQQSVAYLDPANLHNLRDTISQQFDIEILLKHRELGLIEQEIAKTQICIEQLRRCTLKPYQSPEISLEAYIPEHKDNGIPDYAPPHWSVVDGPYTRHYRQWLLPDPRFDGYGPEGPPVYHAGKTTRSQKGLEPTQTYTVSGRPQRQSVIKVQQRGGSGTQQCIFRRSDGVTVRLECLDCKRSDFSSAQGFINHCRIAHQREYASHEAAAFACGQTVEETDEGFTSPFPRNPVDPPSRNTRQTQQQVMTPQSSFSSTPRGSLSGPSTALPAIPTPRPTPLPKNKSAPNTAAAQRKNGRISSRAAMTTPRRDASENGFRRPPTPPQDGAVYKTPHLEGLLKRKKIEIDLTKMVKEVKGEKIDWDMETWSSSESSSSSDESDGGGEGLKDRDGDVSMTGAGVGAAREPTWGGDHSHPVAATRQEGSSLGVPAVTSGRSVSRVSPAPSSRTGTQNEELHRITATQKQTSIRQEHQENTSDNERRPQFNMGMDGNYDYDASSSDDEDGYKSDADAHEDVEMDVESATSHSSEDDHLSPTNTSGFKPHIPRPSQTMASPSSSPIPHITTHQPAAVEPISPALSVTTEDAEREMGTPARPHDQTPVMLTPISPAAACLAKQVRFVMPTTKNGIRKLGNNPGGVLESGLAKMKFGNVRKNGAFGAGEVRKMEG